MKKTGVIFLILMLFSFNVCASTINQEIFIYNNIAKNICEIKESGIKIKIITKESTDKIISKIRKIEGFENIMETKDSFKLINIIKSNEKNIIEIEVVEKNNILNIEKIKKDFQKLVDDTTTKVQYFSYIKGKLNSEKDISSYKKTLISMLNNLGIKNEETLEIANGITGIIELENNFKINYGITRYDTGTDLIIGTPVIFTTY